MAETDPIPGIPAAPANATKRFYAWDHLGSVRVVTDETGTAVDTHDFEPYGVEILPSTNTAVASHLYDGQERDAAGGLDYMHYRYYGSSMGRFLKPDNVVGNTADPQSWNMYAYVRGNPISFNDPTGHNSRPPLARVYPETGYGFSPFSFGYDIAWSDSYTSLGQTTEDTDYGWVSYEYNGQTVWVGSDEMTVTSEGSWTEQMFFSAPPSGSMMSGSMDFFMEQAKALPEVAAGAWARSATAVPAGTGFSTFDDMLEESAARTGLLKTFAGSGAGLLNIYNSGSYIYGDLTHPDAEWNGSSELLSGTVAGGEALASGESWAAGFASIPGAGEVAAAFGAGWATGSLIRHEMPSSWNQGIGNWELGIYQSFGYRP